jgi:protein involved in polysaccharide export with SLBB domain
MVSRRDVVRLALALPFLGFASAAAAQEQARFFVVGLVRKPGEYKYKQDMTVGDALDEAGGFTPGRTVNGIEIIRRTNGETETINVSFLDTVLPNDTVAVR